MSGSGTGIGTMWGASSLSMLVTLSEAATVGSWALLLNGGLAHPPCPVRQLCLPLVPTVLSHVSSALQVPLQSLPGSMEKVGLRV